MQKAENDIETERIETYDPDHEGSTDSYDIAAATPQYEGKSPLCISIENHPGGFCVQVTDGNVWCFE